MFPIPTKIWNSLSGRARQMCLFGGICLVAITATVWLVFLMYSSYSNEVQQQYQAGYKYGVEVTTNAYAKAIKEAQEKHQQELLAANQKAQMYYEMTKEQVHAKTVTSAESVQTLRSSPAGSVECFPAEFMQEYNASISADSTGTSKD